MKKVVLDNRLGAVVELLGNSRVVVDIGCDHGYIPSYLIENKKSKLVYATDISKESLKKTIEYSLERNNFDKIVSMVGDGFNPVRGLYFDSVIIAGMGGDLIIDIIEKSLDILENKTLILQPMTVVPKVREFLFEKGFLIEKEKVVFESGKFYEIIRAKKVNFALEKPCRFDFSEDLIKSCDKNLLDYIKFIYGETLKILDELGHHNTEKSKRRVETLEKDLLLYEEIINECNSR